MEFKGNDRGQWLAWARCNRVGVLSEGRGRFSPSKLEAVSTPVNDHSVTLVP
jgi:hypothetical protein